MNNWRCFYHLVLIACLGIGTTTTAQEPFPVAIRVDASQPTGTLKPIWRFFGADEPNYAYMKDGKKLLAELGEMRPKDVYFRTHNLLTSGDGTPALKWGSTGAYREDDQGKPVYDWTILDRIFDTYLERGVRPYAQIGFMPKELSTQAGAVSARWKPGARYEEIYTGWAYPPKDYSKWAELVFQWTKHCVEKYGRAEVETWYWQTWNEPNIGYWRGTPQEFRKLHDYAIDAVRRALPTAKVGGPDTAGGGRYLREFLEHCVRGTNHATGQKGTPIDFVSFHAKGAPRFVDGHVQMGIANQLRVIDSSFAHRRVVSRAEGQADRHRRVRPGRLRGLLGAGLSAERLPQRHPVRQLHGGELRPQARPGRQARRQPRRRAHLGVRVRGPALLRRLSLAGDQRNRQAGAERLPHVQPDERPAAGRWKATTRRRWIESLQSGVRGKPDVAALASLDGQKLCVLAWHYHDDDVPGPAADVELELRGLPLAGRQGPPAALPHRRGAQQRLHRLETNGIAAGSYAGAISPARRGGATRPTELAEQCRHRGRICADSFCTPAPGRLLAGVNAGMHRNRRPIRNTSMTPSILQSDCQRGSCWCLATAGWAQHDFSRSNRVVAGVAARPLRGPPGPWRL